MLIIPGVWGKVRVAKWQHDHACIQSSSGIFEGRWLRPHQLVEPAWIKWSDLDLFQTGPRPALRSNYPGLGVSGLLISSLVHWKMVCIPIVQSGGEKTAATYTKVPSPKPQRPNPRSAQKVDRSIAAYSVMMTMSTQRLLFDFSLQSAHTHTETQEQMGRGTR